jgi:hypothetical protein
VKSEGQSSSVKSSGSNPMGVSRTITTNVTVNGAAQADFNTSVDALMKAIQSKDDTDELVKKNENEVHREQGLPSPVEQVSLVHLSMTTGHRAHQGPCSATTTTRRKAEPQEVSL